MSTKFLPHEADAPRKRVWRTWKWAGLIAFVAAIALQQWLPSSVSFLGFVFGLVAIANLTFHLFGYLRNRLFWRVRNRILVSFVVVGLIPLLVILGVAYVASRMVLGQLGANYVETSLRDMERELSWINAEIREQLPHTPQPASLQPIVAAVASRHAAHFPRLSARLVRQPINAAFETVWKYDPQAVEHDLPDYPADKWLGSRAFFEGVLKSNDQVLIKTLRPIPNWPGYYLDVSAPLDTHIEQRLAQERSIYAAFSGASTIVVTPNSIQVPESDAQGQKVEQGLQRLQRRSRGDSRWQIWWLTGVNSRSYSSGRTERATAVFFSVPVEVLYRVYLKGAHLSGLWTNVLWILLGFFVVVEVLAVVIGVTISRRITRSVHDMYQGTLALQSGDLQHRIPVRRKDQLGALSHSFNQMSASIVKLLEEVTEKKRLEQELEIAREVQATLFPKQLPHPRGLSIFGGCEPARVVSGDYYDFIVEDEDRLHIIVGDISGKGISAALLMANLQAAVRTQLLSINQGDASEIERNLARVITQLNAQIYGNSPQEKYATLFSGRYDVATRQFCYCNAGHLPPILMHNGGMERLEVGGTVLGLFADARYEAACVELLPGTVVVIFTDGITEAVNLEGEEFGEPQLIATLKEALLLSPEAMYRHVVERVRQWQGTLQQHDDITLIVGKVD
ncbi:MAG: SpoIIE family protein phosphatase [Acidobacteriota bacterium]